MKRFRGNVLALPAALALLTLGAIEAQALPFYVGDTRCGRLTKRSITTSDNSTRSIWRLEGCAPIENLVKEPEPPLCGNGVVDEGEICDTALANSCGNDTCVACTECTSVTPTPTPPGPTPTPTPAPTGSANCPQGELPPLGIDGFDGWLGRDRMSLPAGTSHAYCVTVTNDTPIVSFSAADRSGAAQCLWQALTVIPPPKPPAPRYVAASIGTDASRDTALTYQLINRPDCESTDSCYYWPTGTWVVKIQNLTTGCNGPYSIYAHQ